MLRPQRACGGEDGGGLEELAAGLGGGGEHGQIKKKVGGCPGMAASFEGRIQFARQHGILSVCDEFREIRGALRERLRVITARVLRIEHGIDEQLCVIEEGGGGAAQKINLGSLRVQDEQGGLAMKQGKREHALEAKPERFHLTIPAAGKMAARIEQHMKGSLRTEVLIRQQIDEDLPPPAEQQAIDGARVLQTLQRRTEGRCDGGGHGGGIRLRAR